MPTYIDYVCYASEHRFQPLSEKAFLAMLRAGFNPITNTWNRVWRNS